MKNMKVSLLNLVSNSENKSLKKISNKMKTKQADLEDFWSKEINKLY